jgi:hypothetical protein
MLQEELQRLCERSSRYHIADFRVLAVNANHLFAYSFSFRQYFVNNLFRD